MYVDEGVCVSSILIGMTTPPWWREKVIVYYNYGNHSEFMIMSDCEKILLFWIDYYIRKIKFS